MYGFWVPTCWWMLALWQLFSSSLMKSFGLSPHAFSANMPTAIRYVKQTEDVNVSQLMVTVKCQQMGKDKQISKGACYTSVIKRFTSALNKFSRCQEDRARYGLQLPFPTAGNSLHRPRSHYGNCSVWFRDGRGGGSVYSPARFEFAAQLSALLSHGLDWTL